MPNDKFGVKMLYPNLTGDNVPKPWFMDSGFEDGPRVRLDEKVSGNGTDGYKLDDNSMVRFTVSADSKDVDIECDNNFADNTTRGYVYKPNDWMGRANSGVEMTLYVKCSEVDQSDSSVKGNPVIWKGPTGEHHSNTDCCSGSAHMIHVGGENEDLDNRIAMRFSKEMWHVDYFPLTDYKTIPGETWAFTDNKWFGVKYVIYKKTIDNNKAVQIDVYLDANADKQSWKKVMSKLDNGGWGNSGDDCDGDKDDRLAFGNSRMMWRWDHRDGNDLRMKWGSIREIDPNADFNEDPEVPDTNEPTTTTFRSVLKLKRDINSIKSTCGSGGLEIYFQITDSATYIARNMSNTVEDDFRDIVAERANPAGGSTLDGEAPKQVYFMLRKNGSPVGTVRAKIWDSAGVEKYQSVNTITASTLPTSLNPGTYSVFDMSTNTYVLANGDRIGVTYTGTDPANNISIKCRDPGDGSTGSFYTAFYDDTNTWGDIQSRDVICQVFS